MKATPPKLFHRFFRWYCHPKMLDYIEGDLLELYRERVEQSGKRKADIKFAIDVLLLFRPGIIRPREVYNNSNPYIMYKSYLILAWRNLRKNFGYSFINIGGLTLGMAVAVLIGLWINDELHYNRYFENHDKIAQVVRNITLNDEIRSSYYLPYSLGEELKTTYGNNFERVAMAYPVEDYFLSKGVDKLSVRGEFIEPVGPEIFSLHMLYGSRSGLRDPHSILLSSSVAKTLFGDEDPIDKLLRINNTMDVKVTGVYEDIPHNAHFNDAKFFAPWELLLSVETWMKTPGFTNNFMHIYVELKNNANFKNTSNHINDAILKNIRDDEEYVAVNPQIFLHPMEKWHLYSDWKNGVAVGARAQIVWLFGIVGVFVLLLACINFMNLSTARSDSRAKEVGIRKAIGSQRSELIHQFFSESFLVVFVAFLLTLIVVSAALPYFNELAGKQMMTPWTSYYFWLSGFAVILVTGLLAGSYPALYLSSFTASGVLKGIRSKVKSLPRQVLVVIQFTVSMVLIIGTTIVYLQIQYAKDRPSGYSRDRLIIVPMISPDFYNKQDLFRTELKNTGMVAEVAESSSPPTDVWTANGGFYWDGKDPAFTPVFATLTITPEYGNTVNWEIIKGRDFSRELASDSACFIINEAAAKILGYQEPVGETIQWNSWRSRFTNFTIIGVVNDMVMSSPYAPQLPAVFFLSPHAHHFINIRIHEDAGLSEAVSKIESVFNKLVPSAPFEYRFIDDEYSQKFSAEERIGKLATVFAFLAITISCFGLFGLASFIAERRTKEIGIRKVSGASMFSIWSLLSKDFLVLVLIASGIAIPIAYFILSQWLQTFEYHTTISGWIYILTLIGALVITLLTISYHAIRAASMNPVKSLRSE